MKKRFRDYSLEKQLYISFVGMSALVLLAAMAINLYIDVQREYRTLDKTISSTAAYIANLHPVVTMLEAGYPSYTVQMEMDSLSEHMSDLNGILICDTDSLQFYRTSRLSSGESLLEGEQDAILAGAEPYISMGYSTRGTQRRAFHAVRDSRGEILGFVMTSIFASSISARIWASARLGLLLMAGVFVLSLGLSRFIVQLLKSTLHGLHPQELLQLYLEQRDLLNALDEGLVGTDPEGGIVFCNRAALALLGVEEPAPGTPLGDLFPGSESLQAARTGRSLPRRTGLIGSHQVIVEEMPILQEGHVVGVLSVLNDKTEMMALSDELSGMKNTLDTLRQFNHEFMNKLHVILGYLQTGKTEKAISFIMNSSLVSSQAIRETANSIRVSEICALVIGKMMHAAELGILLKVSADSYCREDSLLFDVQEYITIIGNLLENAIEELADSGHELKEICFSLYCRPDCSIIVCEDTGRGISPEIRERVLAKGVSSKGSGRGYGLYLVSKIVRRRGGIMEIETEQGAGTIFTLTFTKEARTQPGPESGEEE